MSSDYARKDTLSNLNIARKDKLSIPHIARKDKFSVTSHGVTIQRHCEERSDVAIFLVSNYGVIRSFASLRMTRLVRTMYAMNSEI